MFFGPTNLKETDGLFGWSVVRSAFSGTNNLQETAPTSCKFSPPERADRETDQQNKPLVSSKLVGPKTSDRPTGQLKKPLFLQNWSPKTAMVAFFFGISHDSSRWASGLSIGLLN